MVLAQDLSGISIAIDAGHGTDSRNQGPTGLREYDINMKVVRFLEDYLYSANIDTVILTQFENRPEPGLSAREDIANSNGVDWFHSVHHNAFNGEARYTVDIYQEIIGQNRAKWPQAVQMSELVSEEMFKALRTSDWFVRSDYDIRGFNFGVLNDLIMPGELSEATFFDHVEEEKKLRNDDFLQLEACAIFKAILHYYDATMVDIAPLAGIVRDAETQIPINDAIIRILDTNYEYVTDNYGNGLYAFPEMTQNQFFIEISASGYQTKIDSITTQNQQFNFLDFDLLSNVLPLIENSTPSPGDSLISPYDWIDIQFTRQMDAQSVFTSLIVEPSFPWDVRWLNQNSTLRIVPQVILSFDRQYRIQIDTTATDFYGNPIDGQGDGSEARPFILDFKTAPIDFSKPQILATSPYNTSDGVIFTDVIRVDLNKSLDESSLTKENLVLLDQNQNRVNAIFRQAGKNDKHSLVMIPDSPFNVEERYVVTLRKSLTDSNNVEMDNHYQFRFKTDETVRDYILLDDFNQGLNNWSNPRNSERSFGFSNEQTNYSISAAPVFKDSTGAMKLEYQFTEDGLLDIAYQGQKTILYLDDIIGMYIFGDGSNSSIRFYFNDPFDGLEAGSWHKVDWVGWKLITFHADIDTLFDYENGNGQIENPLEFAGIQISGDGQGSLSVEDVHLLSIPRITDVDEDVDEIEEELPGNYILIQGYPNPFSRNANSSGVSFTYEISPYFENARVKLSIFNTLGQQILQLVDENQMPGNYEIFWNVLDETGQILPAGIYFYRLQVNEQAKTQRLVILN